MKNEELFAGDEYLKQLKMYLDYSRPTIEEIELNIKFLIKLIDKTAQPGTKKRWSKVANMEEELNLFMRYYWSNV